MARDLVTAQLLTVQEFAFELRVHPKTVHRWLRDGAIEAERFGPTGRTIRIPYPQTPKRVPQCSLVLPNAHSVVGANRRF